MSTLRNIAAASAAAATVAATFAPLAAGASTTGPTAPVVVVSGLNNPRQLSLVGQHTLFIAEAGRGGRTRIGSGADATYIGPTGSVSMLPDATTAAGRSPHRVITGLLSAASRTGEFAVGSDGVSARRVQGPVYVVMAGAPPDVTPQQIPSPQLGKLLRARPGTPYVSTVADISQYEATHDQDGQGVESDPYAVLAVPGGELVADAAANDVLHVDAAGVVTLFHVFANVRSGGCKGQSDPPGFPGCNFVPTSLATDRHGNVYVGGLVSESPGDGRVVELTPDGSTVLRVIQGFTSVTGVAVGRDGTVYVSQLEAPETNPVAPGVVGVVTAVWARGGRTDVDVPFPAGLAVDDANNVYVSAFSVASSRGFFGHPEITGQVWRFRF